MKDFYDYYAIDWVKTGDNIRSLLFLKMAELGYEKDETTYIKLTATVLHKEVGSIYTWLNGSRHPSLEDLLLLTKFFDQSIEDVLVIQGETDISVQELYDKYSKAEHKEKSKEKRLSKMH